MSVGSTMHGWGAHLNAGAAKVWGAVGHGLGWAGKGAASLAGQGAGAFASSWGLFLSKAWAPAMPLLGKAGGWALGLLGKGGVAAGKGFAKGAAGSLQGLATLGAVGLGAVWALGRMSAARRTVTRRVTRIGSMLGVRRGGAVPPAMVMVETGSSETGTSMVAVIALLLVLWYVMSLAFPTAGPVLAGIAPSSYACNVSAPVGGMTGVVSGAGAKLHDLIGKPPPTPAQEAESVHKFALWLGRMWATFQSARDTGTRPEHVIRPLQDPAAFGGCCNTGASSTTINAGMPTSGSPAVVAAKALAQAEQEQAGKPVPDPVEFLATAGAESTWNPKAANPSGALGLWQLMPANRVGIDATDPVVNARRAVQLWQVQGWGAWVAHSSGAYLRYTPEARSAWQSLGTYTGPVVQQTGYGTVPVAATCNAPSGYDPGAPVAPADFDKQGNPRTVAQAVAWDMQMASSATSITPFMCDHYVAAAYGWDSSGSMTARAHWDSIPAARKHVGADGTPPRGALVFWANSAPGHVAVSLGDGTVATTDAVLGRISVVPIKQVDGWGPRLGWSAPFFPGRVGGAVV